MRSRRLPFPHHLLGWAALLAIATHASATPYFWSNGAFGVLGLPNPMVAPDTLTIQAGGVKTFTALTWTNGNVVSHEADGIFGGSATLNNAGLWDLQGDSATFVYNVGNRPDFVNTGTLRKSAGTSSTFGTWAFISNGGVVDAQVGVLNIDSSVVSINGGTSFRGAGTVRMGAGGTFNGGFVADNLEFAGGNFVGNAAQLTGGVASSGNLRWAGGTLLGSWQVGAGTALTVQDGAAKQLTAADLVNNGTIRWQSTNDLYGASSTLTNNGLFEAQANSRLVYNAGNRPVFVNTGTLRAVDGVTLTNLSFALVNNGGTLDAGAGGAIVHSSGANSFNAGTKFTGAGQNIVAGDARFVDAYTSANLVLQSGIFNGGDGITPGSKALAQGATTWTGGQFRGAWELAAGHTLTALDGGVKQIVAADLVNNGTIRWQSTNDLYGASSTLTNNGLFEAQANSRLVYNAGNRPVFVNTGTLRAVDGVTLTNLSFALVNNGGTLDAGAGGAIVHSSGANSFNAGTKFTGAGQNIVAGDARFVDAYTSANLVLQSGIFNGGDGITPGSKALAQGATTWTGGQFRGAWELAAGHTLTALDGDVKQIVAADLVNNGTIRWQSTNDLYGASSTLTNNGLFEAQANSRLVYNAGNRPVFVNTGTLRAVDGVTLTNLSFALVNNGGTLDAGAGGAIVHSSGANSFNAGTKFTGAGQNIVAGDARFVDAYTSANLVLQSGIFNGGDGITPGSKALAQGATTWTGGQFRGAWELAAGHTLTALDGGVKQIVAADLVNNGTIRWQSTNDLYGASSTLTNNGLFEMGTDADLVYNAGNRPLFVNNGVFIKSDGGGETSLADVALVNEGTIDVRSGSIRLPNDFVNDGRLMGTGGFTVTTLTNAGSVAPGALWSPGTLTIDGNYVQNAGGFFEVDIGTLANSDMLLISGMAALDGTLALFCYDTCGLAIGDELVILDSLGQLSGAFDFVTMSGFASGGFDVFYDTLGDRVFLRVTEDISGEPGPTVPEPGSLALMFGGLAALAVRVRRRRA